MENEIKFPYYCCFGKLQFGSVIETAVEITASYQMFGIPVHKLSYYKKGDSWQIQDLSPSGKRIRLSGGQTLDKAILMHMLYIKDETDELLSTLRDELLKLENVRIEPLPAMGEGINIAYSPAGKLFLIRLLICLGDDFSRRVKLLQGLPVRVDQKSYVELKMNDFYETGFIINGEKTKYDNIPAYSAEFLVPLAFVYDTVKWISVNKLLNRDKLDRIIIQDSQNVRDNTVMGIITKKNDIVSSTVLILKGFMVSREEFKLKLLATQKINYDSRKNQNK